MISFGLEGSKFRTVSQSVSEVGIELLGQLKKGTITATKTATITITATVDQ